MQTLTCHSVKNRLDTRNSLHGRVRLSAEGRRCDESLHRRHAEEPPTTGTERRRLRMGAAVPDGRRPLAIFRIQLGAGGWKVGERSAQNLITPGQKEQFPIRFSKLQIFRL